MAIQISIIFRFNIREVIKKGKYMAEDRGLANADKETRERVAREGGKSSHGGGRPSSDE
jgi:general stress protein YciG